MAWKHIKKSQCPHTTELKEEKSSDETACAVCDEEEDLRICLSCSYVACCESHNSHNTEHYKKTAHPFIKPQRCDYDWLWCYKCEAFLD